MNIKTSQDAANVYIKSIKQEGLTSAELSLARESFNEGWLQCALVFEKRIEHEGRLHPSLPGD